jgi:DNA repair exonuclease SbcCD ATPase subunit
VFDDVQVKVNDLPEKQEFEELKSEMEDRTDEMDAVIPAVESAVEDIEDYENASFVTEKELDEITGKLDELGKLEKKVENLKKDMNSDSAIGKGVDDSRIQELENQIAELDSGMTDETRERLIEVHEKMAELDHEIKENRKELEEISQSVEKKQKIQEIQGDMQEDFVSIKDRLSRVEDSLFHIEVEEGEKSLFQYLKAKAVELVQGGNIEKEDVQVYRCDMCTQRFRSSKALQEHKKDVHSDELEKCDYCGENFALHKSLLRHKLREHRGTLEDEEPFLLETLEGQFEFE